MSASRARATLAGLAGIALWASETTLAGLAGGLPALEVTAGAFAAAALLMPLGWLVGLGRPSDVLRMPPQAWLLCVPSLVAYHALVYHVVPLVPAAPAAVLQGLTPIAIVTVTACLPGGGFRWWHGVGALLGLAGSAGLALSGGDAADLGGDPRLLAAIALAALLWGLYSIASSRLGDVPPTANGWSYALAAAAALSLHLAFEATVAPDAGQALAVAGLGVLPMGTALVLWDVGLRKGNLPLLGVLANLEPLVGAAIVVAAGRGSVTPGMAAFGLVVVAGAALAARGEPTRPREHWERVEPTFAGDPRMAGDGVGLAP